MLGDTAGVRLGWLTCINNLMRLVGGARVHQTWVVVFWSYRLVYFDQHNYLHYHLALHNHLAFHNLFAYFQVWSWLRFPIGRPTTYAPRDWEHTEEDRAPTVVYFYEDVSTKWGPSDNLYRSYTEDFDSLRRGQVSVISILLNVCCHCCLTSSFFHS